MKWKHYLPVDINPRCKDPRGERSCIRIGGPADQKDIAAIAREFGTPIFVRGDGCRVLLVAD